MNLHIFVIFSLIVCRTIAIQNYKYLQIECKEFNNLTITELCEVGNKNLFFKLTTLKSIEQVFVRFFKKINVIIVLIKFSKGQRKSFDDVQRSVCESMRIPNS